MVPTTEIGSSHLDAVDHAEKIDDRFGAAIEVLALAEKPAAMISGPAVDLFNSSTVAPQLTMLDSITKSFKFHDNLVKAALGGPLVPALGVGFNSIGGDPSKSFYGDLIKGSTIGLGQSYLEVSGSSLFKGCFGDATVGLIESSFKHLTSDLAEGLFKDSGLGFAQGLLREETSRLMAAIASPISSGIAALLNDLASDVRPALWLGSGVCEDPKRVDQSVDAWLYQLRPDLRQKYRGMRDALETSIDPVLHAAASAVELLLHLCEVCEVSDREVRLWAIGTQFEAGAIDARQGIARVTWAGRMRLVAIRAGFDEVGQALIISLAESARDLQRMKHSAHLHDLADVERRLMRVDELLSLLAWRL